MALPSYAYGDPEKVAIRHEEEDERKEKACGECRNRVVFTWYKEEIRSCEIKYMHYGKRCEHFRKNPVIREIEE